MAKNMTRGPTLKCISRKPHKYFKWKPQGLYVSCERHILNLLHGDTVKPSVRAFIFFNLTKMKLKMT
jgi:UDP-2,3-diacylglucosamine pyrophosphatase LpxH